MCVCQGCLLSILLYNIVAEVLANLINAYKRIKGIQIGDHDIKIVNFADNTTIFLRDITCLNRMQVILKLVSTIFYQIWKIFFVSSKKLFLLSRYSNFCDFPFFFHTYQIQKGKWKRNNLWCHELTCINLQINFLE